MGTTLRLKLKPGFREPLNSGTGFVGRAAEVARLSAILRHRPAATVLVSGHRGVGKTALVDEALRQCADSKTIVARLSLPHIHPGDEEASRELRGQILRSLARSLHFAIKDHKEIKGELKSQALALYDKSYLKDLQEQGQLKDLTQAEVQHRQANRNETHIEPGKVIGVILGSVGAAAVAVGGIAITSEVAAEHGLVWALLSFAVVMVAAVAAGITATKIREETKTVTTKVLEERSATKIGSFDLSPETLEYELQELLTNIKKSKVSAVFVIDELDKLEIDTPTDRLEDHVIFSILASLKNFFTLGSGIYIFISGEDFYARMEASIENSSYSLAHTLFTDRLFVHVLPYGDIEKLIDGLLAESPDDAETYRMFRNYLCWESCNHVFDLLTLVGDFVVDYEGDTPILEARESGEVDGRWHEGNLAHIWILAAALQKIVGATFDESVRPGGREERFNQALWLLLLDVAKSLARTGAIIVPRSGYQMTPSRWTEHLLEQDVDDLAGAVDRLLARGERYGLVTATEATLRESTQEDEVDMPVVAVAVEEPDDIPATEYAIVVAPPYPDSSVGTHAAPSPFEQGFLEIASALRTVSENLGSAGLDLSEHHTALAQVASVADNVLNRTDRKATPRSTVRATLRQADELLPVLLTQGVDKLVAEWATVGGFSVTTDLDAEPEAEPAVVTAAAPASTAPPPTLSEFAPMHEMLAGQEVAYSLVTTADTENQVLVVQDLDPAAAAALQKSYTDVSPGRKGQDRRVQRLPIVEVRRSPPEVPIELPQEVITVVESNPHKGFIAWFTSRFGDGAETTARQVTETLAGWTVFAMSPDAANLGELRDVLSKVSYLSVGSTGPE